MTVGTERIEAPCSASSVRSVDTSRVSEVRVTKRELRFFVSDGLAPHVPLSTFPGDTGVQAAREIARRLGVPIYRVSGPFWRQSREPLSTAAGSGEVGWI